MISLKTITLHNFKSFRGEVIIGPIEPITVVMGPNGSGKSNIIDAIRFVLGENTNELRVACLSELVYGASIKRPTMEDVYVAMILNIDDKERNFKRIIHGESSQYEIDHKIVTHQFYMTELRDLNLNINIGNFLVPQSYVECIAMKNPNELTEMLEQFSGSHVHKAEYDRLKMEVQKAENKAQFVQKMIRERLLYQKCMREEKAEAQKYTELREQYVEEKIKFQLYRLLLIKKTLETLQCREREVKSQVDGYLVKKNDAMNSIRQKELDIEQLSASLEDVETRIAKVQKVSQEKRIAHCAFEEAISYWQKKYDFANASLDSANKAHDANKRTIEELESELEKMNIEFVRLRETESEEDIELSNSQVERYMNLKTEAENRVKDIVEKMNNLTRNQQPDRDKLEDCNRRKQELVDKVKRKTLLKKDYEERFNKLRDVNAEYKAAVTRMTAKKEQLAKKFAKVQSRVSVLEKDVAKVSEEHRESDYDNYTVSHQMKKATIIRRLKESFSGVYDRLCNLCKPIHPRYKIAVTKVLKRYLDGIVVDSMGTAKRCIEFLKNEKLSVELFLPLDSLKTVPLKEKLRSIQVLKNVKLLYDVIDISSPEISKVVLFVTENTLVCETAEDARKLAFQIWRGRYDCVSLDGCLFRKSGIMSGGEADLAVRAKQWADEQVAELKNRKAQLVQELRSLPTLSHVQTELNEIDAAIRDIKLKNQYIEADMKNIAEKEIATVRKELSTYDLGLSQLNTIISEIQRKVEERDEEIGDMKRHLSAAEDDVFVQFCKDINVPNISYYEKTNLRIYKEQKERQLDLEKLHDRIESQLSIERGRDMTSKIITWETAARQANAELREARAKENVMKIVIEGKETNLSELSNKRADMNKNLETMKNNLAQCMSQLDVTQEFYVKGRKMHLVVQKKAVQRKEECNTIFKECKIEDISIPMLPSRDESIDFLSSTASGGINLIGNELNTESSSDQGLLTEVDFSQCPDEIRNETEENLQDIVNRLDEKLKEIKNQLDTDKSNLKAQEKMQPIAEQIREAKAQFKEVRKEVRILRAQFENVQARRCRLFSECLQCISTEIDSIYKDLVNDQSAQAYIVPENPEEPYAGTINYSCIAPNHRFQPMQNLSGGQKTLASLALLFAMQRFRPTPFFVMDEGDAALDKKNVKNLIRFIESQARTMQFIIVTFNKKLRCSANALTGITTETDDDSESFESNVFTMMINPTRN